MIAKLLLGVITFISFSVFSEDNVERIKVTGSHIKRLDQEGTSPVTVIDREQLNLSGAASMADVIRNLGVATSGVSRKTSLADGNGLAVTSFRGLPTGYVVILLNGKRIANSIDLNLIPKSSIERVEVIKDGASSIYGSDAIGGVMNFITKRGDVGAELVVGGYLPEPFVLPLKYQGWRSERWADVPQFKEDIFGFKGGESAFAEFTYGWSGDSHQSLVGLSFQRNQKYHMQQRPHSMGTDVDKESFSSMGSPGSYILSGEGQGPQPMPGCPEKLVDVKKGICKFNYFETMNYAPSVNTLSAFINTDLDLDDDNELFVQAVYALENSRGILAPAPQALTKKGFVTVSGKESAEKLQKWNNWTNALQTESGLELSRLNALYYRLVDERGVGQRKQDVNKHTFVLQAELTHYLSDSWSLNASINSSGFYQTVKGHNYALKPKLLELDDEGRAKFNPFRTDNKSDVEYAAYNPTKDIMHAMTFFEGSVDGDLFSFEQLGTLSAAFGGRGGYEHWSAEFDDKTFDRNTNVNNQWGGDSGEMGSGGRYWFTGYSEFVLPIQFSLNNILELQMAGSIDYYQYAGVDANPKLAFKWMPGNIVQVRGSAGTGFKAPELKYALKNYKVIDHPYGTDYRACPEGSIGTEDCTKKIKEINEKIKEENKALPDGQKKNPVGLNDGQYEFIYLGNEDLKPEKSTFYNLGIGVEPVKNIFFGIDYFANTVEDRILQPQISEVTALKKFHETAFTNTFEKDYSTEITDDSNKLLRALKSKFYNFGSVKTRGLEANLNMQVPILSSSLFLGAQAVYYIESLKKRPHLDKEFISQLGHWAVPVYVAQSHLGMRYKNGTQWFLTSQLVSRFNQNQKDPSPKTLLQGGLKSEVCAPYKKAKEAKKAKASDKAADEAVCQVARHFNMDFNILFPIGLSTKLLFKVENVLNTAPPEHRVDAGNQQQNINGMRAMGFIPVGMYKGVNGRALTLQVNHKF